MRNVAEESIDGVPVADIGVISGKFSGVYPTAIDVCAADLENAKVARRFNAENLAWSISKHRMDASAKYWKRRLAASCICS